MIGGLVIRAGVVLVLVSALVSISCSQRPYRLRYLSFERVADIEVDSMGSLEVEGLMFSSHIPLAYSLRRPDYTVALIIEKQSFRPRATLALRSALDLRMVARPGLAMRAGREAPCGAYDDTSGGVLFSWSICGDRADRSEYLVAFDVVDASGRVVGEERLPFELKRDGICWIDDSL